MSKGFDSSIPSGTDFLQTAGYETKESKNEVVAGAPEKKSLDPFEVFGKSGRDKFKGADGVMELMEDGIEVSEDEVRAMGVDVDSIYKKFEEGVAKEDAAHAKEQKEIESLGFHGLNPFPFIFKAKYDFKFEENRAKIEALMNTSNYIIDKHDLRTPELGGGTTSVVMLGTGTKEDDGTLKPFEPPHAWKEWEHFTTVWLPEQLENIWKAWRLEPAKKYISESWINEHPPGAWTEEHDHQNVTIAMGCYLNVPRDGGRLMIRNPLQTYKYSEPIHHTYWDKSPETGDDMSWAYIPVATNDVIFFPGWLRHKTEVNHNGWEQSRYIMSLNIRYEFPMRGSIAGMQNLPEAKDVSHSKIPKEALSGDAVMKSGSPSREAYDKSILN